MKTLSKTPPADGESTIPGPSLVPKRPLRKPRAATPAPVTTPDDRLVNRAVAGLARRASGCVTCEVKTTYEIGPDGERTIKNQIVTRKQNPPDLSAIVFALTNTDPVRWRVKPAGDDPAPAPGDNLIPVMAALSEEMLRGLLGQLAQGSPQTKTEKDEPK